MDTSDFKLDAPLITALLAAMAVVLCADLIILTRWLVYSLRMNEIERDRMSAARVAVSPAGYDLPGIAPPAVVPQPEVTIPPPFARKWSLIHPFLGFQFVLIVASLALAVPMVVAIFLGAGPPSPRHPLSGTLLLIGILLQNFLLVAVSEFSLRRFGTSLMSIGLRWAGWRKLGLGLALGAAVFVTSAVLEAAVSSRIPPQLLHHVKKMGEQFDAGAMFLQIPSAWTRLLFALSGAIAAPIGEEIFFRGLLYNCLKNRLNVPAAIVLSGLAFAVVHVSPLSIGFIFVMGMFLAYVYEKTQSLWVTIAIHAVNNGAAFLALAATSGRPHP